MKSEKGLIHLLVACEVIVLVLTIVLGAVKQIKNPNEPVEPIVSTPNQVMEVDSQATESNTEETEATEQTESAVPMETFSEEVETILSDMSLASKVAQLFLVSPETLTNNDRVTIAGAGTKSALTAYPVGGLVYAKTNFLGHTQMADLIHGAQQFSAEVGGRYLFIATQIQTETGTSLAVANDNGANSIISVIRADGTLANTEEGAVTVIPLLQQPETIAESFGTEGLRCFTINETIPVEDAKKTAVLALQNGADMLCVKTGFTEIYTAVLDAVNTGELNEDRIHQATGRIITRKIAMPAPAR